MTATLGTTSIIFALVLALWGITAPVLLAKTGRQELFGSIRTAILGQFLFVSLASGALVTLHWPQASSHIWARIEPISTTSLWLSSKQLPPAFCDALSNS
ncbi:MAG: hypothetical protein QF619_07840, partial [Candidatus Binatia bacterium]|nr:hypothetical protein [Candidatus Binatia bacterium]